MVMSFRVSELQVLLGYAGRNKTGRKTELLNRALQLVSRGASVPIQIKIRELYKYLFYLYILFLVVDRSFRCIDIIVTLIHTFFTLVLRVA